MNRRQALWFWAIVIAGMLAVLALNKLTAAQQREYELVEYEIVRIACELPEGCDLTVQQEGKGRPLTLRCRDGCVVMAQDTVIAQTTLQAIIFQAAPDTGTIQ